MARPSAEEMFKNMIGRRDTPEQHRQLKEAAFHRDCDMSELVRQALDQFFA